MSKTPRTDKVATDGWSGDAIAVPVDFAQQLELELELEVKALKREARVVNTLLERLAEAVKQGTWSNAFNRAAVALFEHQQDRGRPGYKDPLKLVRLRARNIAIAKDRFSGMTFIVIGEKHGISAAQARTVCEKIKHTIHRKHGPCPLKGDPDDPGRRANLWYLEKLLES